MNFEKIKTLAKRKKIARLGRNEAGEQWIGIGNAAYKLENMPVLDEETVLAVMGVERIAYGKWIVSADNDASDIYKDDVSHEVEVLSEDVGMDIIYDGMILTPVFTTDGIFWIQPQFVEPIGKSDYRRYFVREKNGYRMLAIKEGMFLVALVAETEVIDIDDLTDKLRSVADGAKFERVRRIRRKEEAGQMKYQVCERCGAHLDFGEKCDCSEE